MALLVGMGLVALVWRPRTPAPDLHATLVATVGNCTPFGAMLTGFSYPPPTEGVRLDLGALGERVTEVVDSLAGERRGLLLTAQQPEDRRSRGLVRLFRAVSNGGVERAGTSTGLDSSIADLEAAVASFPGSGPFHSDLAAALWYRGSERHEIQDLLAALEHADAAVAIAPDLPEARFNLALALDSLYLWYQATQEYRAFVRLAPRSDWADPARRRVAELEAAGSPAAAEVRKRSLDRAALDPDPAVLTGLVAADPELTRAYIEKELLPAWGRERLAGHLASAGRLLASAKYLSAALAAFNGDRLALGAVEAAEHAGPDADPLARGYDELAAALPDLDRRDCVAARPHLQAAGSAAAQRPSPLYGWLRYYLAMCDYWANDDEVAYRELEELAPTLEAGNDLSLAAQVFKVQALLQLYWGDLSRSRELYERAQRYADATGEKSAAAAILASRAGLLDHLGERATGGELRLRSLEQRGALTGTDRLYLVLAVAANAARKEARRVPAVRFQNEAVEAARRLGDPVLIIDALRQLAACYESFEDRIPALAALEESSRIAAEISDPAIRSYLTAQNLQIAGRLLAEGPEPDLAAGLESLNRAIEFGETESSGLLLPALRTDRARLLRRSGDLEGAEDDLTKAIAAVEEQRERAGDPRYRVSFFDQSQSAYDELIDLRLSRGETAEALALAEQARTRVLLDQLLDRGISASRGGSASVVSVDLIRRSLDESTVLLEYGVYGERVVCWIVERDGVTYRQLPITPSDLDRQVSAFRDAIRDQSDVEKDLEGLHRELIAPLEEIADRYSRWIIVPHKELAALPFSSLRSAASGRYLFQDRSVVLAPSASFFALSTAGKRPPSSSSSITALIVGNPALGPDLRRRFPSLANAEREATEIAGLYRGRSLLLLDKAASVSAVLGAMGQFAVLHFATHAEIDARDPLHSRLLLADSPSSRAGQDLTASDLLELDLSAAQVVVLSACDTGAGPISTSEGPLSLVRPFLAAGARQVVASLWRVDDETSMRLMTEFHRQLGAGHDAATALANAKAWLLDSRAVEPEVTETVLAFETFGT